MVPFDVLYEKWSYGVAHSAVLINVTDFSFNLMSIWCKAACLYMSFSIFLWLTNAHWKSYSLMYHSSFCIMLPMLFSLFHCEHLEWKWCFLFEALVKLYMHTQSLHSQCCVSCNTSKSVWNLPCCTQNFSLLKRLTQYS